MITTYEQMETELTGAKDSTISILENFVRYLPRGRPLTNRCAHAQ